MERKIKRENFLLCTSVTIVSGSFVTLQCNSNEIFDGKHLMFKIFLTGQDLENWKTMLTGAEVVQIQIGTGADAVTYVCEDNIGDLLYSDRLRLDKCYRIVWGSNGAITAPIDLVPPATTVGGLGHFLFRDICNRRPARAYNGANIVDPVP